ncbi:MAG: hypothetical protein ABIP75_16780, partial [Pyrinomonadaceae bacterium]
MNTFLSRLFALAISVVLLASPLFATCGGGGGGGGGGMSGSGSGGNNTTVYNVPWKIYKTGESATAGGLILYWFPATADEIPRSALKESRSLSLYAGQCVEMKIADDQLPGAKLLVGTSVRPVVVLANPDGTAVGRVENDKGKFKIGEVEKLVGGELKKRETGLDTSLKEAKVKVAGGDKEGAVKLYQTVASEKCMFPKKAKEAAKELKALGAGEFADSLPVPNFDPALSAQIVA